MLRPPFFMKMGKAKIRTTNPHFFASLKILALYPKSSIQPKCGFRTLICNLVSQLILRNYWPEILKRDHNLICSDGIQIRVISAEESHPRALSEALAVSR